MTAPDVSGRGSTLERLWKTHLDTLAAPPAIALVLVAFFAGVRLIRFHGDATRFVVAGTTFVDAREAPRGLYVLHGGGYDGQFFYRLALDPARLDEEAYGIHFDIPVRRARIGYPALAWAAAGGGQRDAVPWALIALNVAGVALLAFLGGVAARDAGRHPLWGLLLAAFPGFVFTVARDLSEVLAVSALVAGLLLYRRGLPLAAGGALAVAVLTRETVMLAIAALAVVWLARSRRALDATAWLLPVACFVGWEAVVDADVGSIPLHGDRANITAPFAGLVPKVADWLREPLSKALLVRFGIFLLLIWVVVLTAFSLVRSRARLQEKIAWAAFLALAVCLSGYVYLDPADFRVLGELWALSMLLLFADPRRQLALPALATAALWGADALYRVVVI